MLFLDTYSSKTYTLQDIYTDYIEFMKTEPLYHADTFKKEFFEILIATINGRNDIDILGLTGKEISNYTIKLGENLGLWGIKK